MGGWGDTNGWKFGSAWLGDERPEIPQWGISAKNARPVAGLAARPVAPA